MKKILVTGAMGYIGSHTVVELQQAVYTPLIADDISDSNVQVLDQIAEITGQRPFFERTDLCDASAVEALIQRHSDLVGVIHFAAFKAVGESVQHPLKYYRNNFFSLINLLTALGEKPINFVFSSSCTVYGQPDELPVSETAPVQKAESPYGNTKQVAEEILAET